MSLDVLAQMRDLIQQDPGQRGLAADPAANLFNACADDFAAACHSISGTAQAAVAVVTGFFIPAAQPPAAETDGPLGAVFLAQAFTALGIPVVLVTDSFCHAALEAGLEVSGLSNAVTVQTLTNPVRARHWDSFRPTHLIALERVGPSHTPESLERQHGAGIELQEFLRDVHADHHDRCHNMRGIDITDLTSPAHLLFEAAQRDRLTTIGIGDGGNEIGMGKIPWQVIRRNIRGGATIACRVPTDHLIVAGISNWGAYALAAGVCAVRGQRPPAELFSPQRERRLLEVMLQRGPLVDGVTGRPTMSVDGLPLEQYAQPLQGLANLLD
jgi:hypothetical protein